MIVGTKPKVNPLVAQVAHSLEVNGIAYRTEHQTDLRGETGERIRVDFYLFRAKGFDDGMYVECKWQASSGSAYQKLEYSAKNIRNNYDRPTVMVVSGTAPELHRMRDTLTVGGKLRAIVNLDEWIVLVGKLSDGDGFAHIRDFFDPEQPQLF